jgi:hypothetical protein
MYNIGQTMRYGNLEEVNALRKALSLTSATDSASLTGGDALRIQSLDTALKAAVQDFGHFKLYNKLAKHQANAYVDEWTEETSVGGYLGGSINSATGTANAYNGTYTRRTCAMSTFSTLRQIPYLLDVSKTISPALAVEQMNGIKQVLSDVEYLCFAGDHNINSLEFDGFERKILDAAISDHVYDMNGAAMTSAAPVIECARALAGYGSFGFPSDVFWNNAVQADMDMGLEGSYRVVLDGNPNSYMSGSPVSGIRSLWGNIATNWDVFLPDENMQAPFEVANSAKAATNGAPATVTTAASSDTALSKFSASRAGNYYWAATALYADGSESVLTKDSVQAVAAGEKVTLTIAASSGGTEVGYVVYRSKQDGTNTTADYRRVGRVVKGGATTTYVDRNTEIPGSCKAFVLSLNPAQDAASMSSLLDPIMFPLASSNSPVMPFLVIAAMALRVTKYAQHAFIKNIVPTNAIWRPFSAE